MRYQVPASEALDRVRLEWLGMLGVRGIFDGRQSFTLQSYGEFLRRTNGAVPRPRPVPSSG